MTFWKQLLLSLVIVLIALASWIGIDPGAAGHLARLGVPLPEFLTSYAARPDTNAVTAATPPAGGNRGGGNRSALVIAKPAESGTVNDRFSAIGTGAPVRTVSVRPQVSGQIATIAVASGAVVEAGSVLIELDSSAEEIAVDKARIGVDTARQKQERAQNLLAQKTISSVEADQAATDLANAELALRQAELDLSQRTIRAPIGGTIGILGVNPGDYVTNQSVIATIDDRESILIEFFVPERLVGLVRVGAKITASAVARPGETFEGEVTAVDNRLDEASRTLRVRAAIPNAEDRLRAGMSFEITMRFAGDSYPSVDPLAIQWDSNGSYVWRINDGKAERVAVGIVQRNLESVLVNANIAPGDEIVVEGVQNVRQGGDVRFAGREQSSERKPTETIGKTDATAATPAGKAGS